MTGADRSRSPLAGFIVGTVSGVAVVCAALAATLPPLHLDPPPLFRNGRVPAAATTPAPDPRLHRDPFTATAPATRPAAGPSTSAAPRRTPSPARTATRAPSRRPVPRPPAPVVRPTPRPTVTAGVPAPVPTPVRTCRLGLLGLCVL
jgi:hypothetical protein